MPKRMNGETYEEVKRRYSSNMLTELSTPLKDISDMMNKLSLSRNDTYTINYGAVKKRIYYRANRKCKKLIDIHTNTSA